MSFGEEAQEDEEENKEANLNLPCKSKSTHDVLNDPDLSSKTIIEENNFFSNEIETESKSSTLDAATVKNKIKRKFEILEKAKSKKENNEKCDNPENESSESNVNLKKQKL